MPGVRRTAVVASAFLLLSAAWATAETPHQHVLPAGTAVVFVTDAPLDAGRREGDVITVHLRDNLVLDGNVLAPAGARAQLLVGSLATPDGKRRPVVTLDRFTVNGAYLPVKTVEPIVPPLAAGAQIDAVTLAEVLHIGDRWSVRIPFPFKLSGDQPASTYTPTPARTASARSMMRPDPKRSASPQPSAAPTATALPEPAATKIPGR
jgi:hypothetical protein